MLKQSRADPPSQAFLYSAMAFSLSKGTPSATSYIRPSRPQPVASPPSQASW